MLGYKSLILAASIGLASVSANAAVIDWAEMSAADGTGGTFTFTDSGSITFTVDPALGELFEVAPTDRAGIDLESHSFDHVSGEAYIVTTSANTNYRVTFDFSNFTGDLAEDLIFGLDALGTDANTQTAIGFSQSLVLLSDLNGNAVFDGTNLSASSGDKNSGDFLFEGFSRASNSFDFTINSAQRDGVVFSFAERQAAIVPTPSTLLLFLATGLMGIASRRLSLK